MKPYILNRETYLKSQTDKKVYLKAIHKALNILTGKTYTSELPPIFSKERQDLAQPTLRVLVNLNGKRVPRCYMKDRFIYLDIKPGEILVTPPNCYLGLAKIKEDECIEIIVWQKLVRFIYHTANHGYWLHTKAPIRPEGFNIVQSLSTLPPDERFDKIRYNLAIALMNTAILELEDDDSQAHGKAYHTYSKALDFILKNLSGDLSRSIIAKECGVTEEHLSRLFIKFAQMDLVNTIRRFRIHHAEILLRQTDLAIKEIAALSGFQTNQTFIRLFKQSYGVSPGRYRNNTSKNI